MTWVKLGDEFADDADDAELSDAAVRTHVEALSWSNRRLLDLEIPKRHLTRFAGSRLAEPAVAELVAAGWWLDLDDRWRLVHRPEWQPTRAQVEAQREDARARQERSRRHRAGDHSQCTRGRYCPAGAVTRDTTSDDTRESRPPDPARPEGNGKGKRRGGGKPPASSPADVERCKNGWPIAADGTCCAVGHVAEIEDRRQRRGAATP